MRILLEAHHPAHVHFWKYPVRELLERGHAVLLIGRDRDTMRRLLEAYDGIPAVIPPRRTRRNRFPLGEMLARQATVARHILTFKPDVVASVMGSYTQAARLLGVRNVIFTDSEFQHFNHRIAHPFATEIHTPYCFYKPLGPKQRTYKGIHELAFLDGRRFTPDFDRVRDRLPPPHNTPRRYIVIRLSAWNTLHDIRHHGFGHALFDFVDRFAPRFGIAISAEEDALPHRLKPYAMPVPPEDFHHLLAFARFCLTEGASTAAEACCLGVPTVYINSTEPRGYLQMLETDWHLCRTFHDPESGLPAATAWLDTLTDPDLDRLQPQRQRMIDAHGDVVTYVRATLGS